MVTMILENLRRLAHLSIGPKESTPIGIMYGKNIHWTESKTLASGYVLPAVKSVSIYAPTQRMVDQASALLIRGLDLPSAESLDIQAISVLSVLSPQAEALLSSITRVGETPSSPSKTTQPS